MNFKKTVSKMVKAGVTFFITLIISMPFSGLATAATGFSDVGPTHPNYAAIMDLQSRGIVSGYPDGTFRPDQVVNRVEALKIILLGAKIAVNQNSGTGGFKDTKADEWYAMYLLKAKELGIVGGYPDGTFKPNQTVNLVENLKILMNALKIDVSNLTVNEGIFADAATDQWYAKYLAHAKTHMWIMADEKNMIHPSQGMTRGKLAQLLDNAILDLEKSAPLILAPPPSPTPSPSPSPNPNPAPSPAPPVFLPPVDLNVSIQNFAFNKDTMTVALGTKVRWTNKDSVVHTVTSDDGKFDSKGLGQDQTFDFTFSELGTFSYHCSPHPNMKGTIIVKTAIQVPTI